MNKRKILVVDDRIQGLKGMVAILSDEGYQVIKAANGAEALALYRPDDNIDVILADLKMPGGLDGLQLFHELNKIRPTPPYVIMTAYGTVRSAVTALKEGVTDYLIKPLDYDELIIVLDKVIKERRIRRELNELRHRDQSEISFHGLIGTSRKMRDIFEMVRTVGPTDASVLIRGETGTGKELLARAIHLESPRRDARLVCINCAALTESLLEAELFGYVKGAFTGAATDRPGRLEAAAGGTLFLDEIAHMSLPLQAKLLRFLQERTFEPVGASTSRHVDIRLITASNSALQDLIKAGKFLADLLYRIEVITLRLPPLRERKEDLPHLVVCFIRHFAEEYNKSVEGVRPEAMEVLLDYPWPGNVREMKNCLARAVILAKGPNLAVEDLSEKILARLTQPRPAGAQGVIEEIPEQGVKLQDMELDLISKTLQKCAGNKSRAAKLLGISRKALYQKIERFQLPSSSSDHADEQT
ncbi:MAG: sigma-54-dependent Fis family transcriptional regulator [Deltaproteobacteria bacterium]|nr:sigma-54-dependent Fis family transcriptional regulator [Deltaproteobacteria bacterium]